MLKQLSILAAFVAFGVGSADAQQREAIFQKIEIPGASFDVVLATAERGGPALYYRDQPDPNIIDLGGGLVAAYTAELSQTLDIDALMHPAHTTIAERGDSKNRTPAVVYLVPKPAQ